ARPPTTGLRRCSRPRDDWAGSSRKSRRIRKYQPSSWYFRILVTFCAAVNRLASPTRGCSPAPRRGPDALDPDGDGLGGSSPGRAGGDRTPHELHSCFVCERPLAPRRLHGGAAPEATGGGTTPSSLCVRTNPNVRAPAAPRRAAREATGVSTTPDSS